MKGSRFACAFSIVSALLLGAMLVTAGSAVAQEPLPLTVTVTHWGQSEINEDGNLRFRVTASASGIIWTGEPDPDYLQLWAHIEGGPTTNPIDTWVLIKSKAAYDRYGHPATSISGTSPRFKLPRGTYTYELFVVLSDGMSLDLVLAWSAPHLGGTVTLP